MKASLLVQDMSKAREALESYGQVITQRNWPVSAKLELYSLADACVTAGRDSAASHQLFDRLYASLVSYWQLGRSGEIADSNTAYDAVFDCIDLTGFRELNLTDDPFDPQGVVRKCLERCKDIKRLRSGAYPFMPVSKLLHPFNPRLIPIYDRALIDAIVYKAFKHEWKPIHDELTGQNYEVPLQMDFMIRWSHSLILWASSIMKNASLKLMEDFSCWASGRVERERSNSVHPNELKRLKTSYAFAFEALVIGAAILTSQHTDTGVTVRQVVEASWPTLSSVTEEIKSRDQEGLSRLLDSLMEEGDASEQRETWEFLRERLETARDSNRLLRK